MATIGTFQAGRGGGLRLTIRTPGAPTVDVAPVSRKLLALAESLRDWRPFWRAYAFPLLAERTQRNFDTEGGFVGGWAPLSPAYAAWKANRYPGQPILQREGSLYRSLTWTGEQIGPGGIARAEEARAEFGTTVPYAGYHQRGTSRMPQRRVLAIPDSITWGKLLQRFATDRLKATGFNAQTVA